MVEALGSFLIKSNNATMDFLSLGAEMFAGVFKRPFRGKEFIQQLYFVANQSIPIVVFCVSFAAMVTIIEASFHMKLVIQNDSLVPGFATLLILRELGAVLAALLLTSRGGAGYAAEVGSMTVTEQVDALRMLNIDPVRYLLVPRFLACAVGGVVLSAISNATCVFGAMVVSTQKLGYSAGGFLTAMNRFVDFQDLFFALIKGGVFAAVIPWVACYYGFRCRAGAEGVGLATTSAVVTSSVMIIILDFILTWIFAHFY
jgi:phospholipid/cholesterol/gamma-HCH transport system permease protein